jgi:hypothetical protein
MHSILPLYRNQFSKAVASQRSELDEIVQLMQTMWNDAQYTSPVPESVMLRFLMKGRSYCIAVVGCLACCWDGLMGFSALFDSSIVIEATTDCIVPISDDGLIAIETVVDCIVFCCDSSMLLCCIACCVSFRSALFVLGMLMDLGVLL